ncbi:MAG: ABC-type transport auxiliary lipoprotein family protein [Nitrospinota bacterium]
MASPNRNGCSSRRPFAGAAACLALLLAAGCGVGGGEIPDTRYFVIDYAVPAASPGGPALPVTVGVESFRADAVYRTDRIVYRKVPHRVDFYPYERWGARPEEFVTDRLLDHLQASRRFQEVVRATGGSTYDYLVRGRVKRFEEVNSEGGKYSAVAQVEVSLVERRTGRVLLQRQFSGSSEAKAKPPQGFVAAMAESLRGLLDEATGEIAAAAARHHGVLRP